MCNQRHVTLWRRAVLSTMKWCRCHRASEVKFTTLSLKYFETPDCGRKKQSLVLCRQCVCELLVPQSSAEFWICTERTSRSRYAFTARHLR
jgi:hypothetical protein